MSYLNLSHRSPSCVASPRALSLSLLLLIGCAQAGAGAPPSAATSRESVGFAGPTAEEASTQFVTHGDVRYAYRRIGRSEGVPLLLLTRFRANMDDWDPLFLNELGRARPVIIFNNAGVATSSGQVPRTIKGAADHAARVCKALGLETVDILGWSMAGFTAQVMAIEYPQLVRQVVLIGTGPGASPETPPPSRPEVFEVATRPTVTDTIWQEQDHEYLFFAPGTAASSAAVRASLTRIHRRNPKGLESPTTQTVMERQSEAIQGFWFKGEGDYFQRLKELRQPTLILNGDRDAFFNVSAQVLLYREIPNSRLGIYPMAGHGPHHQYPREVAKVVDQFLNEQAALTQTR